ncbi:13306_t:CDS:2 [Cetraspora pellucida]|uniref:Lysophospholipase n=1 Tax=Cetraspora pellucida TaxID=1433469 RepID=A0A9N9FYR4_9GLOM|nr:13306_t:CDS:2 [Cetraspora pellucida]
MDEKSEGLMDWVKKHMEILHSDEKVINAFKHLEKNIRSKSKDPHLYPELNWDATVRKSNDLCEDEKKFVHDRKLYICEAFARYVGVEVDEIHPDDIPIIALTGSGGGIRSMICATSYFYAAQESGLYDCGIYVSGVSGSGWGVAQLYTSMSNANKNPIQAQIESYRTKLDHNIIDAVKIFKALADNSSPQEAVELAFGGLVQKKDSGIHLSLVDIYGALLGAMLLIGPDSTIQSLDFKLSSQKKYVEGGKKPLPVYAAIYDNRPWKDYLEPEYAALIPDYDQVLERHKMKKGYFQWYEFTPFEFGCEEFPSYIPTWAFGRKFESGKNVSRIPEQNFGLILGLLGSSPAGTLKFDLQEFESTLPDEIKSEINISKKVQDKLGEHEKDVLERIHPIPQTNNHNYNYHLYPPPYELGITSLRNLPILDPAPSNELPMYPLTNPSRKIDIIIGFNSARQVIEHELFDEQQNEFCKRRGYDRIVRDISNKHCEIYDYIPNGKATAHNLQATNPTVFCHMPYLKNDKVDPTFEPLKASFTNTINFIYTAEQVDLMFNVAKQNWLDNEHKIKEVIIKEWKKKRIARQLNQNSQN